MVISRLAAACSLGLLLGAFAGCAHQQPAPPAPEVKPALPVASKAAAPTPEANGKTELAGRKWDDIVALLNGTAIHFEFDDATLLPDSEKRLEAIAQAMLENPGLHIRISGNCDERGTEEYNLALGDKRAYVARTFLVHRGIDGNRIETISYGKDKPADRRHNEEAWFANRRDEFLPTASN